VARAGTKNAYKAGKVTPVLELLVWHNMPLLKDEHKMAKTLSKRIAARMKKNDAGLKKSNRTIFLALRDQIEEALNDGWTVKVVWETLKEEGKVAFSYQAFNGYVNRLIKNEREKPDAQGTVPATEANGKSEPGRAETPGRIPRFDWEGRKTKKEDLI
jgi:hypothetical protein